MDIKGWANLVMNVQQSAKLEELSREHQQSITRLMRQQADRDRQREQDMKDALSQRDQERDEHEKLLKRLTQELKKKAVVERRQKKKPKRATPARGISAQRDRRNGQQKRKQSHQELLMAKLLAQKQREEARLKAIALARQELFECRKAIDGLTVQASPLATHFYLAHLKERMDKIDVRYLTELADKEYHARTVALWSAKNSELLPNWNDAARAAADRLFCLLHETCERIKAVHSFLAQNQGPSLADMSLAQYVEKIEPAIEQIERLLTSIPDVDKASISEWTLIEWARGSFILPYYHNVFLFRCAVLIAKADGQVDDAEKRFLNKLGEKMLLTPEEMVRLIDETISVSGQEFSGGKDEARTIFKRLCVCAAVDGHIDDQERFALSRIAGVLGLDVGEASSVEAEVFRSMSSPASGAAPSPTTTWHPPVKELAK